MIRNCLALLLAILFSASAIAQNTRISRTATNVSPWLRAQINNADDPQETVHLLVQGDVGAIAAETQALGGHFKYAFRDFAAISLPIGKVDALAQHPAVKRFELNIGTGQTLNDTMLINNNVVPVHAGLGELPAAYEGTDVVIGIIDTGLDFLHPDFQDSLGNTRVAHLWDQTFGNLSPGWDPARIPQPYGYGNEWTAADIDAGLCTHTEPANFSGHGTNVTGAAAGNGLAVGNYKGVAPKAHLIVVASNFGAVGWTGTVADAVDYIFAKADAMGLPCVVNGSLGSYFGSHDGLDAPAQIIDSLITSTNGRAMVCAAGNCGNETLHLSYDVTSDTSFTWFEYNPSSSLGYGSVFFELWADTADFNDVWFAMGADRIDTMAGVFDFRGRTSFHNIQPNLGFIVSEPIVSSGGATLGTFDFYSELVGSTYFMQCHIGMPDSSQYKYRFETYGSGTFDVWSTSTFGTSDMCREENGPTVAQFPDMAYYQTPDSAKSIVSSWACLDNVITVGNYVNRKQFMSVDSVLQINPLDARTLTPSSSHGPTRDNRLKPDVTASGEWTLTTGVLSILDVLVNGNASQRARVAPEGMHHRQGGTSMASPVVAGVAALYFQKCPQGNFQELIDAIVSNATSDSLTGPVPSNDWGHGRIDALGTLEHTNYATTVLTGDGTVLCPGDSMALFVPSPFTAYNWSDGSTASINYVHGPGNYWINVVNAKGCPGTSDTITIVSPNIANAPDIAVSGQMEFCEGDDVQLSVPTAYMGYTWNTGTSGPQETATVQGNYYVVVIDTSGCELHSDTVSVIVHPAPEPSALLLNQVLVTDTGFTTYQWKRNGNNITGGSTNQLVPFLNGAYHVVVTDSLGCEGSSPVVDVVLISVPETAGNHSLQLWPNPVRNTLNVQWQQLDYGQLNLQLVDAVGNVCQTRQWSNLAPQGSAKIDLSTLPAGVYIAYFSSDRFTTAHKIILN